MPTPVIALASSYHVEPEFKRVIDDEITEFLKSAGKAGCAARVYGGCSITDAVVLQSIWRNVPLVVVTAAFDGGDNHWHITKRTQFILFKPRPKHRQPAGWGAHAHLPTFRYDIPAAAHRLIDGADIFLFVPTAYSWACELAPFLDAALVHGVRTILTPPKGGPPHSPLELQGFGDMVTECPLSAHAELLDAAISARRAREDARSG